MFSNRIDTYTPVKDDKLKSTNNQNFDFDGEGFSSFLDEEDVSGELRETDRELEEDDSILSTDEENKTIAKERTQTAKTTIKETPKTPTEADKTRLLTLLDMSTKTNMASIKITKSKKELETSSGNNQPEEEDLTTLVTKVLSEVKEEDKTENENIETTIDLSTTDDKMSDKKEKNKDTLSETQEELAEDKSILSTDEENLAMVNQNNHLKSEDFSHNGEEDMELLTEIVSINNQANIQVSPKDKIDTAKSGLAEVIEESKKKITRIDASSLTKEDVDYITDLLQQGTADSSDFMNDNSEKASVLSEKFLAMLKDAIVNKKIFRIDFDNQISVIIKIDVEGTISAKFLTSDKILKEGLKHNLYLLRQKFEEQNIKYGELEYGSESEDSSNLNMKKMIDTLSTQKTNQNKGENHNV